MEAEARYTYVGAAVLALVAALVAGVLWLKRVGSEDAFAHYEIHFDRQSLHGLQVGAQVNVRGIKVGRVEDYALAADRANRVRVVVRIDRRVPILTTTAAVVTRNLVTGIADITLVNREPPGPPLTQIAPGEEYPVIAEGRSDLDQLAGRVNEMGELASGVLASINQLLTPENRDAVMDTVHNLRDLTAGLNRRLAALDRTLERSGTAATSIAAAANRLGVSGERAALAVERASDQLGNTATLASEVTGRAGQGVERALAKAEQTLDEAQRALARVTATVEAVERHASSAAGRLEASAISVDDQLSGALAELRLSMEAATRVLDRLREPRAALLGPGPAQLGPGEALR